MAKVVLMSTLANRFTGGEHELDLPVRNVRELIRTLDEKYPGLGKEIDNAAALAIDGEIFQDPFMESLSETAEVFVLPKIGGG